MHSIDRVRKTLAHVRPDRPPADGTFCSQAWELRGFEQFLMDQHLNRELTIRLLDRITEHKIAEVTRMVNEGADIIEMAGDIATDQRRSMTKSLGPQRKD